MIIKVEGYCEIDDWGILTLYGDAVMEEIQHTIEYILWNYGEPSHVEVTYT